MCSKDKFSVPLAYEIKNYPPLKYCGEIRPQSKFALCQPIYKIYVRIILYNIS